MVNRVELIGHLGADPEIRILETQVKVAQFRMATSRSYKKNDEKVKETEWHNVACFRGLAEVIEKYVKKGSLIRIEGRIRTRSYDAQDGTKRYVTEVIANDMTMLGGKQGGHDNSQASNTITEPDGTTMHDPYGTATPNTTEIPEEENDLPF